MRKKILFKIRENSVKKLVPKAGLEPARCCHRGILSPVRLPIPPLRQNMSKIVNQQLK